MQLGLEWIARHQRPDGAWSLDYHGQCTDQGCPFESPMLSDTAATGLGLLPLLGAGHIHTKECRYQDNIRRGLEYLMKNQSPEGELFLGGDRNTKYYSHAIAAMALCEAYGLSKDPRLKIPAQRALNFIAKNQNLDDGGWRYYPGQAGDTSVFGWQMFAAFAAVSSPGSKSQSERSPVAESISIARRPTRVVRSTVIRSGRLQCL